MTKIIALLTIVFVTGLTTSAFAGELDYTVCDRTEAPTPDVIEKAKHRFVEGVTAFKAENYAGAIAAWKEAYALDCTATLLLHHIANAYKKLGDAKLELQALQAYLLHPMTHLKDAEFTTIKQRITQLQDMVPKEEPQEVQPAEVVPTEQPKSNLASIQVSTPPPETHHSQTIPITLTVVGGVATIVGTGIFIERSMAISRMEAQCPDHKCPKDVLANQGNNANTVANVGLGIGIGGLAISAIGITWLALDNKKEKSPSTAMIQPWIKPNGGGMTFQGSF